MMELDARLRAFTALDELRFPELALSAYLPTDPGAGRNYYRALLEGLARAEFHKLSEAERAAVDRELPRLLVALEKRRFDCPAVALFSCQPRGFLRIWRLAEPVPGRLGVAENLTLAPIRLQLYERPPALAALVDKHEARLYGLVLDELTELRHLEGTPIRRHKQGGWSATGLQRRQDEHARANLDEVAGVVARLLERDGYRRLILAGPPEARAELRSRLPARALKLVAAEGSVPMYATGNELVRRLRSLDRLPEEVA